MDSKFSKPQGYKSISATQSKNLKPKYKVVCENGVCRIITL